MSHPKILTRGDLAKISEEARKNGKTVGFTSGSFDLLHAGHVTYLEEAKTMCDLLLVGVNDNASVKSYKGDMRPIVSEENRVRVIAGLECVSYAFLFSERRNQANIEALKPHFYIKAGDYSASDLTSAKYLEPWKGEVKIVPFRNGLSTTKVIERVLEVYGHEVPISLPVPGSPKQKTIFLDRDGVINEEIEYLHEPEKFLLIPKVLEALKQFQSAGYRLAIVTTQAGIGLGYFSKEDFYKVNKKMLGLFHKEDIVIDKVYFCPHGKADGCSCRKPETALFERGVREIGVDLEKSFMIGDKTGDILAGSRMGLRTVLVETGHAGKDKEFEIKPDFVAKDLFDASNWVLAQK
jgi:D-glycero-D-manno-heptose 1,7-bisphosphate phosphatase